MFRYTAAVLSAILFSLVCTANVEARGGRHFGRGAAFGLYFGSPFFGPYGYPYYPYFYPPMVIPVPTAPPTYVERGDGGRRSQSQPLPPNYWYYCADPAGYYPSISQCPSDWIPVAPQPGGKP